MSPDLLGVWLAKERCLSRLIKPVWSPEEQKGLMDISAEGAVWLKAERSELGKAFQCVEQMLVEQGVCVRPGKARNTWEEADRVKSGFWKDLLFEHPFVMGSSLPLGWPIPPSVLTHKKVFSESKPVPAIGLGGS